MTHARQTRHGRRERGGGAVASAGVVTTSNRTFRRPLVRRGVVALSTLGIVATGATMAIADITTANTTSLTAVGPTSGLHGFPVWYESESPTPGGEPLRLEQCLDPTDDFCDPAFLVGEGLNPDLPLKVGATAAESNFPGESFYYQALNVFDLSNGGSMDFTSALEATWANEEVVDGDQIVFGRLRIRVDGLTIGETYTVTHPYGVDTFEAVDDGKGGGEINFTEDIAPTALDFGAALGSRLGPFLVDSDGLIEANGNTYIGDPAQETAVTGSVFGTNFVSISGPGLAATDTNDQFTLMGKVSTNSGVDASAAYRINNPAGEQDYVDVYATSDPGDAIQVSSDGNVVPLTTLENSGGDYYARIPIAEDAFPESVKVVNASDSPPAEKIVTLVDNVAITDATYADGTLTVSAQSSDSAATLSATVGGTPLTFTDGTATAVLAAPPVSVTVTSTGGGTATSTVLVTSATAGTLVPQTAVIAGVSSAAQGQSITLDGSSSQNVSSFAWSQTGGTPVTLAGADTASITFTTPAEATTLEFTLVTSGPDGDVPTTHQVQVLDAAAVPTVTATASNATPEVGASVTLTATATNATSYQWKQTVGTPITGLNLGAQSITFPAPAAPVAFTVTVTSPNGTTTTSDPVTVTPNADRLTVTFAELRTSKNQWRVQGTSTVTALNEVSVWLKRTDGTRVLVGRGAPDATGAWDIRNNNLPLPTGATLEVESTKGGLLTNVPFTSRR